MYSYISLSAATFGRIFWWVKADDQQRGFVLDRKITCDHAYDTLVQVETSSLTPEQCQTMADEFFCVNQGCPCGHSHPK